MHTGRDTKSILDSMRLTTAVSFSPLLSLCPCTFFADLAGRTRRHRQAPAGEIGVPPCLAVLVSWRCVAGNVGAFLSYDNLSSVLNGILFVYYIVFSGFLACLCALCWFLASCLRPASRVSRPPHLAKVGERMGVSPARPGLVSGAATRQGAPVVPSSGQARMRLPFGAVCRRARCRRRQNAWRSQGQGALTHVTGEQTSEYASSMQPSALVAVGRTRPCAPARVVCLCQSVVEAPSAPRDKVHPQAR